MKMLFSGMVLLAVMSSTSVMAAGSDELWEMTTKMDMPGMDMPMVTQTSCLPKGGAYKPEKGQQQKNCEMTDLKVSGNKTSWKMRCSGKDAMEGSGEVTRTADTMNGTMKMSMQNVQMTQIISGKRVGTCDAAAEKQKMDDKVNAMMGEFCDGQVDAAVRSGGYEPRMPEQFTRKEQCAASKPVMCEKARSFAAGYEGYPVYAQSHGWVAAECGIKLEKNRANLCQQAVADDNYDFAKQFCPAEAKVLESKHNAAGRSYTATGRSYTASARTANPESSDNPAATVLEGAKKLKGLFGF